MKNVKRAVLTVLVGLAPVFLAACAGSGNKAPEQVDCRSCGEITNISKAQMANGQSSGGRDRRGEGAYLLQMPDLSGLSSGSPSAAMPRAGVGSAMASAPSLVDVVDLRMDDGSTRRIAVNSARGFRIGQRVRVLGDQLLPAPIGSR